MQPLPPEPFTHADWRQTTVGLDDHVRLEGHHYSVPHDLLRQKLWARLATPLVEHIVYALVWLRNDPIDLAGLLMEYFDSSIRADPIHDYALNIRVSLLGNRPEAVAYGGRRSYRSP